jgi:hypothetical protein
MAKPEQVFSKEYLEKEFPGFYGSGGQATSQEQHPAQQLRGFLNMQGREGWQLLGIYSLGQLLMMIFRRPLVSAVPAAAGASSAAAAPPPATPTEKGALERILERLESLERRLDAGETQALPAPAPDAASPPPSAPAATGLGPLEALQDGQILSAERCRELEGYGRLPSAEAARLLGFRSAASLLNLAARSGYRPGLIKRGVEGRVAIYVGSERNDRGGRDRRLWVVLGPAQS